MRSTRESSRALRREPPCAARSFRFCRDGSSARFSGRLSSFLPAANKTRAGEFLTVRETKVVFPALPLRRGLRSLKQSFPEVQRSHGFAISPCARPAVHYGLR